MQQSPLQLKLTGPLHDIFPEGKAEMEAVKEVIAQAEIEPWKVQIDLVEL